LIELIAPVPLLIFGVVGLLHPLGISLALIFALLPWAIRLWTGGQLTRPTIIGGPLLLWAAGAFVGLAVAYDPALSGPAVLTLLGSIGLFFAIVNLRRLSWQISQGLVIGAALIAFYFVGQYNHFQYAYEHGRVAYLGRLSGGFLPNLVFFTPPLNAVASFLEGTLLLSLVFIWQASSARKVFWGSLAILITYALLITGSRGAWLGLMTGISFWLLLSQPRLAKRLIIGGIIVLVISLGLYSLSDSFTDPLLKFFNLRSWLWTAYSRLTLYRNSFFLLSDYLFTGIGPGETFAMIYSRYQLLIRVPFLAYPHNLFLAVGLSYGLLGLAALVWLLLNLTQFIIRVEREARLPEPTSPLFRAAWLGFVIMLAHGLTDSSQFSEARWTMPMFFALLGLSIATGQADHPPDLSEPQKNGWPYGRLVAMASLGLVVSVAALLSYSRATWYANMGAVYQARADLSPHLEKVKRDQLLQQALNHFDHALALWPMQPSANRRIGMMALELHQFEVAVPYLERAYRQEPHNQATLKLLGLAYLWTGRLEAAEPLLYQLDNQYEIIEELGNWQRWWARQDQAELSEAAYEMARRLYILKERAD
jgi:O-antigen ligase